MSKAKIQRNDPCPCGSGKKYKHCCALLVAVSDVPLQETHVAITNEFARAVAAFNAGQFEECARISDHIIESSPQHAHALQLRGLVDFQRGAFPDAVSRLNAAIRINPLEPRFFYNLGTVMLGMNDQLGAIEQFRVSVKLAPTNGDAHGNLASALSILGRYDEAKLSYVKALALKPDDAGTLYSYGATLNSNGEYREAIPFLVKALALNPNHVDALNNLGYAAQKTGLESQAEVLFKQAIELDPLNATSHFNLASSMGKQSRLEEAITSYRDGLALQPSNAVAHSDLLLFMQYSATAKPSEVFSEHLLFAQNFEAPLKKEWMPHANLRDPDRRLKIGYVSGDFKNHSLAFFIEPILLHHDRSQVDIFCYSTHSFNDHVTDRFIALSDHWRECAKLSDTALAATIRDDKIDILVDLSGHTTLNRMLTFARKPAPVQMTWLGYQATSGLTAMDYRITDEAMDPVGCTEQWHTETLVRMPASAQFASAKGRPSINLLPALSSGRFTYACFNNLNKISPEAIHAWSLILKELPHSKMMIGNVDNESVAQLLISRFSAEGVGVDRLILQPKMPLMDYLALHLDVDLALDTFPYNGGTTTMHSLSMGVPVLVLEGSTSISRAGSATMCGAGLAEFIASDVDEYVQMALHFARDPSRLNAIRQSFKDRTEGPLANESHVAKSLEEVFRTVWSKWCNA